jgi:hypothetical protein
MISSLPMRIFTDAKSNKQIKENVLGLERKVTFIFFQVKFGFEWTDMSYILRQIFRGNLHGMS